MAFRNSLLNRLNIVHGGKIVHGCKIVHDGKIVHGGKVLTIIIIILTSLFSFFFCCFVLFHSCCSHARVFAKTLVHELLISYGHNEWCFIFSDSATTRAQYVFGSTKQKQLSSS